MNTALILIDIQNDYFPGGRMELVGSEQASQCASRLLNAFRDHHLPLVFIQHIAARPGATFFLPDTPGAEIHPNHPTACWRDSDCQALPEQFPRDAFAGPFAGAGDSAVRRGRDDDSHVCRCHDPRRG